MKKSKTYTVPFSGLKLGKHAFDYEVDSSFFDDYEYSLIKKGKLQVHLELEKQETMLILQFQIKGTVDLICDRCLSEFPANTEIKERQLVKFSDEEESNDNDEILVLARNEFELDIAPFIYEFVNVSIPYHKVCNELSTQQCDAEMLKFLQNNSEEEEKIEENNSDPRWEALKKLKR